MLPYTLVPVKSEGDEQPQSQTESKEEDCGSSLEPHIHLQPDTDDKASETSETEDWQKPLSDSEHEDGDNGWNKIRAPDSGSNTHEIHVSGTRLNAGKNSCSSFKFCSKFGQKCLESQNGHERVSNSEKTFGCSICGKRLKTQRNIKRHMRIHTGEKPVSCDVCGKRFRDQDSKRTHMSEHTGERPFSCGVCGKTFIRHQNKDKHMRIHTGEKPFSCCVCGKRFRSEYSRKRHMREHTGEKPFSCGVCGKTFSVKERVDIHMIVHTGEKPFSCDICGGRFTQKHSIKRHMQLVHSKEKL